jgi:HK97 family phage major capsid protein
MTLFELEQRRLAALARAKPINDQLQQIHERNGGRPLDAGDQERWDNLMRGRKSIDEELAEIDEQRAAAILEGTRNGTLTIEPGDGGDRPGTPQDRARHEHSARARSLIESARVVDDVKEIATGLVESDEDGSFARWAAITAEPTYLSAFTKVLRDPTRGHLEFTEAERAAFTAARQEARAQNIGTPAAGGYLLPFSLDPAIILTNDGSINPIRQNARHVTISTNAWHGITSAGTSSEWKVEGAEASDHSITDLDQPAIDVHFADSFVPYSFEAEGDIPNLLDMLGEVLTDAKDRHEATAFTVGDGNGKPKGVITAVAADAGSIIAPTTAESFQLADLYKVAQPLPARHQLNASWMINPQLTWTVRQWLTGEDSPNAAWTDLGDGTPPRLLGHRYLECTEMDSVWDAAVTAAHNYVLLYGDLKKYQVVDRVGTTVELVPHIFGDNRRPTAQRGLFMWWRVGGDCLDTNAFRLLDIPTTA